MNPDLSIFGIFVNGGLTSAALALCLHLLVRRCLIAAGVYRFFWHPALVNVAMFIVWWGFVAWQLQAWPLLTSMFLD